MLRHREIPWAEREWNSRRSGMYSWDLDFVAPPQASTSLKILQRAALVLFITLALANFRDFESSVGSQGLLKVLVALFRSPPEISLEVLRYRNYL